MRNYTHLKLNNALNNKIQSHKLTKWLHKQNKRFYDYQILSYKAVCEKYDLLINAPTGTGKTLAAFIAPIINFESDIETGKFSTIYISPLKSLIYDIKRNLQVPLQKTKLNITVETRTGDTSSYNKQKQLKVPPNFLITTPESLPYLCLIKMSKNFFKYQIYYYR